MIADVRFQKYLEEDPRTNRIDDSLQLFTQICSNKLLKNTHLVLMLNKVRIEYFTSTHRSFRSVSAFFFFLLSSSEDDIDVSLLDRFTSTKALCRDKS